MRSRASAEKGKPARERAFTVQAMVLCVLLFREELPIRELKREIETICRGIPVRHSAVFMAGRTLQAAGLVASRKEKRSSGGGPPSLILSITPAGRTMAEDMRVQAERLMYWPRLKAELETEESAD